MTLDEALAQCPVVAIIRGVTPDEAVAHARALYDAGVKAIEVPLNSPEPLESIRRIARDFRGDIAVGAGTVLTGARVEAAAAAGARFIVAPNTYPEVIHAALKLGLDPAPGFGTATEAFSALTCGAKHLKLFPAVTYGTAHLKQLKAVLPAKAVIWAVGGVGLDSMADWWAAGCRAFGLGGELYRAGQTPAETADKARGVLAAARALA